MFTPSAARLTPQWNLIWEISLCAAGFNTAESLLQEDLLELLLGRVDETLNMFARG